MMIATSVRRRQYGEPGARQVRTRIAIVIHRCDEAIASARNGFDESWPLRIIAKRIPQALDRSVQTVLVIDEHAVWPEAPAQLVAFDDLAGAAKQQQ